jgi:DNA (cytosine-5)-methyltransferase 1
VGFERRALWSEYLRVLDKSGAHTFVMENVPALLDSAEYRAFLRAVQRRGFRVSAARLDAVDFGVAQRRRRAIVIGMKAGAVPAMPEPTHRQAAMGELIYGEGDDKWFADGLRPWKEFRQAVKGLPFKPDGRDWHRSRQPTWISRVRYSAVPRNGGNRFQMQENLDRYGLGELVPACWRNKPSGTTDVSGRLWWDRPALTIRTEFYKPEKGRYLHPFVDRPITVREAANLMAFPPEFIFPEEQSMTAVGRQIGNAVPPDLAEAIGRSVAFSLGLAPAAVAA